MSANSTRKSHRRKTAGKPNKPYPEFPLYPHPLGYWSKKIATKITHFGRWGRVVKGKLVLLPYENGWRQALATYKACVDDAQAGRIRESVVQEREVEVGFTIADLCNKFLTSKLRKVAAGELSPRSLQEYVTTTIC